LVAFNLDLGIASLGGRGLFEGERLYGENAKNVGQSGGGGKESLWETLPAGFDRLIDSVTDR